MSGDRLPEPCALEERPLGAERASAMPVLRHGLHQARPRLGGIGPAPTPTPTSLGSLQNWMLEAITEGTTTMDIESVVTRGPRMEAKDRLHVYQHGYVARLVECLLDDYPVLAASLGPDRFEALCQAYVVAQPSRSPSLNAFGRHMPAFCRTVEDSLLTGDERGFASDLASLEWAIVEVIHAESASPIDASALASLPPEAWESARFVASDAVRRLTLAHPVNAFFQAYRQNDTMPARPSPTPTPSAVVVYRKGPVVWRMDLTPAMNRVLATLLEGRTIADALGQIEDSCDGDPEARAEAARSVMIWFREWVEGGLFASLVFEPA
jgi:hypothetical protein